MTLLDGVRVPPQEIQERIWWHNIHRLRMWSTVGAHEEHGLYAIYGARLGTWMTNCTNWNYVDVRDFDVLKNIYDNNVTHDQIEKDIQELSVTLRNELGLNWANFDAKQSEYICEMYEESIALGQTYYNKAPIWKSFS
jgi:hypothetical protein